MISTFKLTKNFNSKVYIKRENGIITDIYTGEVRGNLPYWHRSKYKSGAEEMVAEHGYEPVSPFGFSVALKIVRLGYDGTSTWTCDELKSELYMANHATHDMVNKILTHEIDNGSKGVDGRWEIRKQGTVISLYPHCPDEE